MSVAIGPLVGRTRAKCNGAVEPKETQGLGDDGPAVATAV